MCVSVNIKRPFFFDDRPYSSSSISNFSNSAVCNSASITSTELCELVYKENLRTLQKHFKSCARIWHSAFGGSLWRKKPECQISTHTPKPECLISRPTNDFRSEWPVSTIFPPYIMSNGTYERIKQNCDTLPLRQTANRGTWEEEHQTKIYLGAKAVWVKRALSVSDSDTGEDRTSLKISSLLIFPPFLFPMPWSLLGNH